jgi:hypothetical protein
LLFFSLAVVLTRCAAWFSAVSDFQMDGVDRTIGLKELMTTSFGRGLGADGIFMDTFDTPAPNIWTNRNSPVLSKYVYLFRF